MSARGAAGPDPLGHGSDEWRLAAAKVAYEEGQRLVDDQVAELDSMRQRAVQFLAFVGSASAFLVGTGVSATTSDRSTGMLLLAALASVGTLLALCLVSSILVSLVPNPDGRGFVRHAWNFRLDPSVLVRGWITSDVGPGLDEFGFYSRLAEHYGTMADENDCPLRLIRNYYVVFIAVSLTQLFMWAVVVWRYA